MIAAAQPKERENLSSRYMDIDDIEFRERFDFVFSNAALHWVKDHVRLYGNVRRALRFGGQLRFNFAGHGNCASFFSVVKGAMAQEEFSPFFVGFDWPWYMPNVAEYKVLAESNDFWDVQVWGENADRLFPDEEAMIRRLGQPSLAPFMAYVPDPAKNAYRDLPPHQHFSAEIENGGPCSKYNRYRSFEDNGTDQTLLDRLHKHNVIPLLVRFVFAETCPVHQDDEGSFHSFGFLRIGPLWLGQ